jgi:putative membrane-bound dehydrogenase-like protein
MRTSAFVISAFQLFGLAAFTRAESFPATNGLERTLVAKEPLIKNAVSVSVDVDGAIYVTESARRKVGDLDIREFTRYDWVPHDVSFTSIDEKLAFFRKELDGKNKFPKSSLKDFNNDGNIDSKDLTVATEKIIRLTDNDGDGLAEKSTVFAENFNTEVTGIAAGVLAWRGDVYATIAPDLWKLRDTNGDGIADKRESLAHGFGLHIAYAGHDMHGLTLGPDGRIYWTIGDKGTNVTSKEGKKFFAPHEGSLLRCYPDGSEFEIFARGLRNPQEIAFDKYGNIFSVDNDSDQKGERERFLHITEGSDTGWRCYYQYRGAAYNPWMEESIWEPAGEFQPAYITPTNMNYSDGPAGFAYNPGTALNSKYDDAFFVTEFPKGTVRSFKVNTKGATFEMSDEHVVSSGAMNVGINFGPDGALYSADWGGGYAMNEKGAVWKIDDPSIAGSRIRQEVAQFLKAGPTKVSTAELLNRLSHKDMRIRLDAQWELANRKAIAGLQQLIASPTSGQLAKIHAMWALSQQRRFFENDFQTLASSKDPILRAQAAKHAGETLKGSNPILTGLLTDSDPQVRFHAATAIWKTGDSASIDAVIRMLAENDNKDPYLRHAGVLALTASPAENIAAKTLNHKSPAVRLAAAVAFRRLKAPLAAKLLSDENPQVVAEAAHAIYDDPAIVAAYPALAALLDDNPEATPPAIRRAIAANRFLGDEKAATRLVKFAANASAPSALRVAALEALESWTRATNSNPVDGRHDPLKPADKAIVKAAFLSSSRVLQDSPDKAISAAAVSVCKTLGIVASSADLEKEVLDQKADPTARINALDALKAAKPDEFEKILPSLLEDRSSDRIRIRAATLLAETNPQKVVDYAAREIAKSEQIQEQQEAILLLAKMNEPAARELLRNYSEKFGKGSEMREHLLLEFTEALPGFEKSLPPYSASLEGGNEVAGEKVFNEHLAAQCIACHRVGKDGSEVGPPLSHIGKKGRDYIFESLIAPQAKITSGYGLISVNTQSGSSVSGALKEETPTSLTLILPDKTELTVKKADIKTRTQPVSVMPPMGDILSPRELRDLIAYLVALK